MAGVGPHDLERIGFVAGLAKAVIEGSGEIGRRVDQRAVEVEDDETGHCGNPSWQAVSCRGRS